MEYFLLYYYSPILQGGILRLREVQGHMTIRDSGRAIGFSSYCFNYPARLSFDISLKFSNLYSAQFLCFTIYFYYI